MTRLTSTDLHHLEGSLARYDHALKAATGRDLAGLALDAAGLPPDEPHRRQLAALEMAVVPVTSGLGLIGGFAQSVAAILNHIGCSAFVTEATDVAGLAEAVSRGPAALFMSDDRDFVALATQVRAAQVRAAIHNTPATARGFAAGLARMAGNLRGREVLLLGCGAVGRAAADALLKRGADLVLADRDRGCSAALHDALLASGHPRERISIDEPGGRQTAELIFDATNTADHIEEQVITDHTLVAAPGMPCGITAAARRKLGSRLLHDPLQIGVATMAAMVLENSLNGDIEP